MTKRLFTNIIGLLFVLSTITAQYDPTAKVHLDKLAESVKTAEGIAISFEAKVNRINNDKIIEEEKGQLMMKGDLHTLKLSETTTFSNGTDEWIYMADVNEVTIQPVDEEEITAASIFNIYEEGYKFRIIEEDNEKVSVELTPEDTESPYIRMTLYINKQKEELDAFTLQSKNGYITNINITEWIKAPIADQTLQFDANKYPESEIIDLR